MASTRSSPMLQVFTQRKMAAVLMLGFASGLPLFLTSQTLQAWMTVEGVDLGTIGLFSLVGLPYSFKFLWAPVMDRFVPPFLGRRRGWLVVTQLGLILAIAGMALHDPRTSLQLLALNAVLLAFFSASQDVVFDAYKVDVLDEREMGAGAALGVLGYRIALILTGSLALILADQMPWPTVYLLLALFMTVGIAATLFAPEPVMNTPPPQSLKESVVDPFVDFFRRTGLGWGALILVFVIVYQLADRLANNMSTPFLLDVGFTQTDVGAIKGGLGLGATILGVLLGGAIIARIGIVRSLWIFGVLQVSSNLAYYWIARVGADHVAMTTAIIVENIAQGLVTSVFVAYMMSLCSKRFSATQFALLTSLMSAARDMLAAPAGEFAERMGWENFFLFTIAAGIPSLLLLPLVAPWGREHPRGAAEHSGLVEDDTGRIYPPAVDDTPGPGREP